MNKAQMEATKHSNKLGAGAKKRKQLKGQEKVEVVMREGYRGTLHSSSGQIVTNPAQMKAIAMSEAGMSKGKQSDQQKFERMRVKQGARHH